MIKGGGRLLIVCFHNIAVVFGLGFVLKMKKYKISGTDYLQVIHLVEDNLAYQ